MCYPKPGTIFRPQRLEVHRQTYLASSIHLLGLSIKLGQFEFGSGGRIGNGDIKLQIELVFEQIVNIPTFAGPARALRIGGGDPEPIVVVGLVHGGVGDERLVLLLEALRPGGAVAGASLDREERNSGQGGLGSRVPTVHDPTHFTNLRTAQEEG